MPFRLATLSKVSDPKFKKKTNQKMMKQMTRRKRAKERNKKHIRLRDTHIPALKSLGILQFNLKYIFQ